METLSRTWKELAARGVLALLFALIAFLLPGITLASLILVFGVFAFADGILLFGSAMRALRNKNGDAPWLFLHSLAGIVTGLITFLWPGVTAAVLIALIAFWAIVTGILELALAIRLRRIIEHEIYLGLSGLFSIILGIFIILIPAAGLLAWVWILGAYAFASGVMLIALALRLRSAQHEITGRGAYAT